jgi:hypothetical protein
MRRARLLLVVTCLALLLVSGVALAATIRGTGGDNRLVGTNRGEEIYGLGGGDFIDAVDAREDLVDCGRLEGPDVGGFDTDTAIVDEVDILVDCENVVVNNQTSP